MSLDIHFERIQNTHLKLMLIWLNNPHVKNWWDKDINWTFELVQKKYTNYIEGFKIINGQKKPIQAYIIFVDKVPIGYIQLYNAHDFPREGDIILKNFPSIPKSLAAIDFFIGEQSLLGKGLGSKVLINFLFEYVDPFYEACFVDPDPQNLAAIKTYEKSGFIPISDKYINDSIWMIRENPKIKN